MALVDANGNPLVAPNYGYQGNIQIQNAAVNNPYAGLGPTGANSDIMQGYDRQNALTVAAGGVATNDEGNAQNRLALGNLINTQAGNFANQQATNQGQFQAQMGQNLNNAMATARRQMGGTGLSGSQQAGANLGNIVGANQQATAQGIANLNNQGYQQLGQMAGTQGSLEAQMLGQQGQTFGQADTLANLLQQDSSLALQEQLGTMQAPSPSSFQQILGDVLGGAQVGSQFVPRTTNVNSTTTTAAAAAA